MPLPPAVRPSSGFVGGDSAATFHNEDLRHAAQVKLDGELTASGFDSIDLFEGPQQPPAPKPREKAGLIASLQSGIAAFFSPDNADQRGLIIYVLVALLVFTTLTTIQSVPCGRRCLEPRSGRGSRCWRGALDFSRFHSSTGDAASFKYTACYRLRSFGWRWALP